MTTRVYIVNGKPRSGKDTLINLVCNRAAMEGIHVQHYSSIQPIKHALDILSVDTRKKTEADRYLLSKIGDLLEAHSNYRTDRCIKQIEEFAANCQDHENALFFLNIREPRLIRKIMDHMEEYDDVIIYRVMVESRFAEDVQSNESDANAHTMPSDIVLENNGTMGELYDRAVELLSFSSVLENQDIYRF